MKQPPPRKTFYREKRLEIALFGFDVNRRVSGKEGL
jgi:hypothetical protein